MDLHHRNGSRRPLRRATGHDRVLSPSLLLARPHGDDSGSSVHLHLEMKQPSNSGEHRTDPNRGNKQTERRDVQPTLV